MLHYLYRNLGVLWRASRRPSLRLQQTSVLRLRVGFSDLDYNLHMNNAKYLTAFELGRLDLVVRTGMGAALWKDNYYPILASCKIRYVSSLAYGEDYRVHSRVSGWCSRWIYVEQAIYSSAPRSKSPDAPKTGGRLVATFITRAALLRRHPVKDQSKIVPPVEVYRRALSMLADTDPSDPLLTQEVPAVFLPRYIQDFDESETGFFNSMKQHGILPEATDFSTEFPLIPKMFFWAFGSTPTEDNDRQFNRDSIPWERQRSDADRLEFDDTGPVRPATTDPGAGDSTKQD
ncbi:hypothetical protein H696_03644 [Fonticula alba]|uniref:Thioesterase n=1 Tax=Fonticula alba TaxID=691883 RepID=A0A058Z7U0_FONAL|nr:hypothetical protein H696_03644 [Fonticula alba]KCV70186.1 hypothetical protein H696_03644 [Fonticula alba]|eukprot:XP_009495792.1 hypothetical protein H696_03644 [Fonticula alba]